MLHGTDKVLLLRVLVSEAKAQHEVGGGTESTVLNWGSAVVPYCAHS